METTKLEQLRKELTPQLMLRHKFELPVRETRIDNIKNDEDKSLGILIGSLTVIVINLVVFICLFGFDLLFFYHIMGYENDKLVNFSSLSSIAMTIPICFFIFYKIFRWFGIN